MPRTLGPLLLKELRLSLFSFRLGILSLLLVGMMVANTLVLTQDWRQRRDRYEAGEMDAHAAAEAAGTYSSLRLAVERPPELLSLLARGLQDWGVRSLTLGGRYEATRIYGGSADGWIANGAVSVDFSHTVLLIMSLLALVLTHDLVNGDREQGTLQLALAYGSPRRHVLIAKYLGALVASLVPFTVGSLLWLSIVWLGTGTALDADTLGRIAGVFLLSILYTSVFLWLGLMSSCCTRHATTSLILCLLLWTGLVVVYPTAAFQGVMTESPAADPLTRTLRSLGRSDEAVPPDQAALPDKASIDALEAATWASARRSANRLRLAHQVQRLSPAAPYEHAASTLTDTGLDHYLDFLDRARRTRDAFERWQTEKVEEHPQRERTRIDLIPLDLDGLPALVPPRKDLLAAFRSALPDIALLLGFNLLFLLGSFVAFRRTDPRP